MKRTALVAAVLTVLALLAACSQRRDRPALTASVEGGGAGAGPQWYTLTLHSEGRGAISVDPGGTEFLVDTWVSVRAVPETSWRFDGWTGALTGLENPRSLLISGDTTVRATFVEVRALRVTNDSAFTAVVELNGAEWMRLSSGESQVRILDVGSYTLHATGGGGQWGPRTVELTAADFHWRLMAEARDQGLDRPR